MAFQQMEIELLKNISKQEAWNTPIADECICFHDSSDSLVRIPIKWLSWQYSFHKWWTYLILYCNKELNKTQAFTVLAAVAVVADMILIFSFSYIKDEGLHVSNILFTV